MPPSPCYGLRRSGRTAGIPTLRRPSMPSSPEPALCDLAAFQPLAGVKQTHEKAPFQCHLPSSTSEAFTIHLDQHGAPFTLDYFVGPVPHDGACPKPIGRKASAGAGSSPAQLRPIANTTVALRSPTFPPLCVLLFLLRPSCPFPLPIPLHSVLPEPTGTASPVSPVLRFI